MGTALSPIDALVGESLAYATLQAGPEFARWLAAQGRRVRPPEREAPVTATRDGDVLHVVLNRPRLHNSYNAAMRDALVEAFVVALADPALQVEISGAGRSFCAGGDLAEFGVVSDAASAHLIRSSANAAPYLLALADRVRVRVQGACVGAGIELAAFAREVRAAPDAFFQLPEVSMGLVPGAGGTVSVPRRIGRQRAAWMALTGARVDAQTALSWGLIDAME
jgi:enoyl-CoA hydratase/carnithine racemase